MTTCDSCGQPISWIVTPNGRKMPVNTAEIPFVPDEAAKYLAVDPAGQLVRGRPCAESYEAERWIYARLSHFATCPKSGNFRR